MVNRPWASSDARWGPIYGYSPAIRSGPYLRFRDWVLPGEDDSV